MRFAFGKNWRQFLQHLSDQRRQSAVESVKRLLSMDSFESQRFLDIGCGSGLFSLAAIDMGAAKVVSFDYDADSVACARLLNDKFGPYPQWTILQGSVLDQDWLASLGKFDVVYSWGVLHHTGAMWDAIDHACQSVADGGKLCLSIYNDQGAITKLWLLVKRFYNVVPGWIRWLLVLGYLIPASLWWSIRGLIGRKPVRDWFPKANERGMHFYYDAVDWLGGYPFETATPAEVVRFVEQRGFEAEKVLPRKGSGCNEFVFVKHRSYSGPGIEVSDHNS